MLGVKSVANAHSQMVLARKLDRSRVKHLRADPRHLQHLFI
jgi:hypothetical protein